MSQLTGMRLSFFGGLRPFSRRGAVRDAVAGVTLASMNIPQVLGYTRIAATPVVTGLCTVLLPLVALRHSLGRSGGRHTQRPRARSIRRRPHRR